jgi:hypothetical protein
MIHLYFLIASPVIWYFFYKFASHYSFSEAGDFQERFLLLLKSNDSSWNNLKYSLQADAKSRWGYFNSANLLPVVLLAVINCFCWAWESSVGNIMIILFVAHLAISAYRVAKINRAKEALKIHTGDCSLASLRELETNWANKKEAKQIIHYQKIANKKSDAKDIQADINEAHDIADNYRK